MRRDDAAIVDIVIFATRIGRHVAGMSEERFLADEGAQDAVIRCLGVIGEAAGRVSEETRVAHPEVPWTLMVAMRNQVVHDYGAVDLREVYRTATLDAPTLLDVLGWAAGSHGENPRVP